MDGFPRIYVINGAEYYLASEVKGHLLKPEDEEEKSTEDESD